MIEVDYRSASTFDNGQVKSLTIHFTSVKTGLMVSLLIF